MSSSVKVVYPLLVASMVILLGACGQRWNYPETRRDDVVDDYFGQQIADPYRWLENDTTAEVAAWVAEQNELTDGYLSKIPFRKKIRARLEELMNYDSEGAPFYTGKYYLHFRKEGLSNQSILYIRDSLTGEPRVLLDPNTLSSDGTVALTQISVSRDSKYLAYAVADGGSDWNTIYIKDIETGETLSDKIQWVKFSSIAWQGHGFYYSCYDAPAPGMELSSRNEYHKLYFHTLGQDQASDRLVYQNRNQPLRNYSAKVTNDEKYLIISETESTDGNSIYVKNLVTNAELLQLTTGFDYDYYVIGSESDNLYVLTNYKAPKYKLVRINMDRTDIGAWEDVIAEQKDVLKNVQLAGGKLVAEHMVDASSRLSIFNFEGEVEHEVDLGVLGSVGAINARAEDSTFFYSYTSFIVPSAVYRCDVASGKTEKIYSPKVDFDFDDYVVEQLFYPSKNGVMVPMFVVHSKHIELNGKNPTLLYGYGGFNISLTPSFSAGRLAWLEQGGVYAVANLRGGGEYGEKWHMAGTKLNKQNVFDDFIAAAEYLIKSNYTSTSYLAIQGGSNGGLLVGAVMNQRPDLFAVGIPQVGVMDMLRYQHFTIGWAWASDYGASDEELHFENLLSYSPLHNIATGDKYPAVLVTTADHDDRVVPAHSFKYIATMQHNQPKGAPKLIRIETRAGHGAGKPTSLYIAEQADIYAFIWHNVRVVPNY